MLNRAIRSLCVAALALSACAGGSQSALKGVPAGPPGYQLAVETFACWFGNLWADAEGYPPPARRRATQRRCRQVIDQVYGKSAARPEAQEMRQMEPRVVDEVARAAASRAGAKGEALDRLIHLVADAKREALEARRAASRLRFSLDDPDEPDSLSPEELEAVQPLRSHAALERLLGADLGELSADARALGLLVAIDRMETVRGAPRELKVFAMAGPGKAIFDVAPHHVPEDPKKPLERGAWLAHLTEIAQAAGYPVPEGVSRREDRNMLAWNGILKGLADRLRAEEGRLSADAPPLLRRVLASLIKELDEDYAAARRAAKLDPGPQRPSS